MAREPGLSFDRLIPRLRDVFPERLDELLDRGVANAPAGSVDIWWPLTTEELEDIVRCQRS